MDSIIKLIIIFKDLGVSWDLKGCEDIEIALKKLSLSSISATWECD